MSNVDLQLLIIGGGVHGTFLSHALSSLAGIERSDIRVLDPFPDIMHYWHEYTRRCGMRYLRSPSSHNMDLDFRALRRWVRSRQGELVPDFIEPYTRPSLPLFNLHTETVIREHRLEELRITGRAFSISRERGGIVVSYGMPDGTAHITARNVLLAIGRSEQLNVPAWATDLAERGAPVHHIFETSEDAAPRSSARGETVVFGGGITAAQFALALHRKTGRRITLLSRHPIRVRMFDSNPCFIGPKCLPEFRSLSGQRRRETIVENRYPGSLPPYVAVELSQAVESGGVKQIVADLVDAELSDGCVILRLRKPGGGVDLPAIESGGIYFATGFRTGRPGGPLVDRLVADHRLPAAPCGYPVTDSRLAWAPGIYTAGPLAELELGPASLNIIGAHNAAKILVPALRSSNGR